MKGIRYFGGKLLVLFFLAAALFFSVPAGAEEQEQKGVLIRLWEKFTSRISARKEALEGEKAVTKTAEEAPRDRRKMPTKKEMIDAIKKRLQTFSEIVDMIPGLSRKEESGGEEVAYYYAPPGGVSMNLRELDTETLHKLYVKVNQQATVMHTERINAQIRQQEQLMRLQSLQQIPKQPVTPPPTSQVYTPPQTPRQPPSPPPQSPRVRRY